MTNEELRIAIATAKGLDTNHLEPRWAEGSSPDGEDGWDGFFCPRCGTPEGLYHTRPCGKNYPEDIAAAMELFEEMNGDINCEYVSLRGDNSGSFSCVVHTYLYCIERMDDTAARAICATWLAWKGAK